MWVKFGELFLYLKVQNTFSFLSYFERIVICIYLIFVLTITLYGKLGWRKLINPKHYLLGGLMLYWCLLITLNSEESLMMAYFLVSQRETAIGLMYLFPLAL